ncbi:hypothetical protein NE237_024987 [Protea cynaroides]|uniref:Cyclin-dependent kinase inhibitor domain-containing protein n=1 Tax=Protea cynaroides TaxID=273540 RepID=A0A9Q0H0Y6_9MAGN|nr:hypothetical protein NE237_024987 [Protea cynaroides]
MRFRKDLRDFWDDLRSFKILKLNSQFRGMARVSSFNLLPFKTLSVIPTKFHLGFRMKNSLSTVTVHSAGILSGKGREVARLRFPIGGENRGVRPLLRIRVTGPAGNDDEWGSEKEEWIGEGVATALGEEEEKIKEPSGLRRSRYCSDGMTLGMEQNSLILIYFSFYSCQTPSSEFRVESGDLELTARPAAVNSRHRSTTEKMPMKAEIEDFFSVAEKEQQKLFPDKYNFDILKDVPLEGGYKWVRVKHKKEKRCQGNKKQY